MTKMINKIFSKNDLHKRVVMAITTLAALPVAIFSIFVILYLKVGFDFWFGSNIKKAMDQSNDIAQAYLKERKQSLINNALSIKEIIEYYWPIIHNKQDLVNLLLNSQTQVRNLTEAIVFSTNSRQIIGKSSFSFSVEFSKIPLHTIDNKNVSIIHNANLPIVRAAITLNIKNQLLKNNPIMDSFNNNSAQNEQIILVIGQMVDSTMIKRINLTKEALGEYNQTLENLNDIQMNFLIIFSIVLIILILVLVLLSRRYSNSLTAPIINLIKGTQKVSAGDFTTIASNKRIDPDLRLLINNFNKMTIKLNSQQQFLTTTNIELNDRNTFIETILKSVPVSVVSLSDKFKINLINDNAVELLGLEKTDWENIDLWQLLPELLPFKNLIKDSTLFEKEIITAKKSKWKSFQIIIVRMEYISNINNQFVMIINDITKLIKAQKKNAWSDVARRIAHEIRNPLTPIMLSVERLEQKYLKQVKEADKEKFEQYIRTINKQVQYIGSLVSNFANFAKMPDTIMIEANINKLLQDIIFLYKQGQNDIDFQIINHSPNIRITCDPRQMEEVFANIIKNAIESLKTENNHKNNTEEKKSTKTEEKIKQILITITLLNKKLSISIEDSGPGFQATDPAILLEPYVTSKKTGVGLGLAMVDKIIKEHKGVLTLSSSTKLKGAKVLIEIPTINQKTL